ncbi:MAG: cation:proton antiporter [Candidatus Enteromonas sp.]|nr:cation:proton antiporter [Candidatus Enteromonas sp.]
MTSTQRKKRFSSLIMEVCMFLSLFLILFVGIIIAFLFPKIKIPALIGFLLFGILLGSFSILDPSIVAISPEIRKIALIIIVLKAGLSLDINALRKVGRPALLLSFMPATFEILAFAIFGPLLLGLSLEESILVGAVLGAVSPAVVVPRMTDFIQRGIGKEKRIPEMIVAGSSVDDVYCIVVFTAMSVLLSGGESEHVALSFLSIPSSIVLGILSGLVLGFLVVLLFKKVKIRDTLKLLLLFALSFLMVFLEGLLSKTWISLSSLLSVITMGMVVFAKSKDVGKRLVGKCNKIWVVAEMFLFVLVGASVKIDSLWNVGIQAIAVLLIGLLFRSIGTTCCLIKTDLTWKERLFVVIAELPKATVQAAIGGSLIGMAGINQDFASFVLSISVLSIVLCAPLGAFGIDLSYKKLLNVGPSPEE